MNELLLRSSFLPSPRAKASSWLIWASVVLNMAQEPGEGRCGLGWALSTGVATCFFLAGFAQK